MARRAEQVPSRLCGCPECLVDYPQDQYGVRPPQAKCLGMWEVRYRTSDGRQRIQRFGTHKDAQTFLSTAASGGERCGA